MATTTQITLPTIVNIREARQLSALFPAIITAGPTLREVRFGHNNHFVRTFDDIGFGRGCPKVKDVQDMLDFAALNGNDEILVHCHAGMSRSTATAWGIAIQRGMDPADAYDALKERHPAGRMFWPNDAIVEALEVIFDLKGLSRYNDKHHFRGASINVN